VNGNRSEADRLGANDAMISPGSQHVPLENYEANLRDMVEMVASPASPYHSADTKVIIITPPPFLENMWRVQHVAWALREGRASTEAEALYGCERLSDVTREYALACQHIAKETGVECVDIHTGMIDAAGGSKECMLANYFT
jgi:lysophospholipase L1-like esterase